MPEPENRISYNQFLEKLTIEFSDFIRTAQAGRTVRHASLRARKQSIKLRDLLKQFRQHALENDKRIANILSEAKSRIDSDIE